MSVAFTKEGDTENAAATDLPDRPISPHPNRVTPNGLARLDAALVKARADYAASQADETRPIDMRAGDMRALARAARDLRYYAARRATAILMPSHEPGAIVRFGSRVTIERADGRRQTFCLVGEDEADPATGTLSYVSPLAAALMGKNEGDTARIFGAEVEIIAVA